MSAGADEAGERPFESELEPLQPEPEEEAVLSEDEAPEDLEAGFEYAAQVDEDSASVPAVDIIDVPDEDEGEPGADDPGEAEWEIDEDEAELAPPTPSSAHHADVDAAADALVFDAADLALTGRGYPIDAPAPATDALVRGKCSGSVSTRHSTRRRMP